VTLDEERQLNVSPSAPQYYEFFFPKVNDLVNLFHLPSISLLTVFFPLFSTVFSISMNSVFPFE
jgi:hypothetical protein